MAKFDNRFRKEDFDEEDLSLDMIIDYVLNDKGELQDFDKFWDEVKAFADNYNLSYAYVEEEFVIDGQLVPVHLDLQDDEEYPSS